MIFVLCSTPILLEDMLWFRAHSIVAWFSYSVTHPSSYLRIFCGFATIVLSHDFHIMLHPHLTWGYFVESETGYIYIRIQLGWQWWWQIQEYVQKPNRVLCLVKITISSLRTQWVVPHLAEHNLHFVYKIVSYPSKSSIFVELMHGISARIQWKWSRNIICYIIC